MSKKNKSKHSILKMSDKIFSKLENIMMFISIIALFIMFLSMFIGVISREVFNTSLLWTNELAGYSMIYLVFLSLSWLLREKGHVMVDLFTSMMNTKMLKASSIVISVVSLIAAIIFLISSFEITLGYFARDITMLGTVAWPRYLLYLPIVIGMFLVALRLVIEIFKTIFLGEIILPDENPELEDAEEILAEAKER